MAPRSAVQRSSEECVECSAQRMCGVLRWPNSGEWRPGSQGPAHAPPPLMHAELHGGAIDTLGALKNDGVIGVSRRLISF